MAKVSKKTATTTATTESGNKETAVIHKDSKEGKFLTDSVSGKSVINYALVEPEVKKQIGLITIQLQEAFTDVRKGFLRIGELLSSAELILKPRGMFVQYLNSFPGFKQAQAYRYINGYRVAKENYPPAVLDSILATGIDMIGTKDRPFGKYQEVVKQLPPPKDADAGKAQDWLKKVEATYTSKRKKENKIVDANSLQKEAYAAVLRKYAQVPEKKQLQWLRGLFGYVLGNLGFKQNEEITPQDAPASWNSKTKQESENIQEE